MFQREEEAGYLYPNDKFLYLGVAMTRAIAYIMLVTILILSMIMPIARSEAGKYYVYEFTHQEFENGKLSLNYSIVVKFVRVNDTAYKVELVKYSGPESMKRYVETRIKNLENFTGGLVLVREGYLPAVVTLHTLWVDPGKLSLGKEAVAEISETINKLCNMGGSREDISKRQEIVRELGKNAGVRMVLEGMFPYASYRLLLQDLPAAGLREDTKYLCNKGFSISVDETKNTYVFKLDISKTTSSNEWKITGKAIYSKNGWLISSTYEENINSKREGTQYTRKVLETAKLVDTNDETVKSAMESTENIEGSKSSNGGLPQSIPVSTETVAVGVGVVTVLALIVLALKKLL